MEENAVPGRASETMSIEQRIKFLSDEVNRFKVETLKWKVEFSVELAPRGETTDYDIIIIGKTGERGFRLVLTQELALYHSVDTNAIANDISKSMLQEILGPKVIEELSPKIAAAIKNVALLNAKTSL